MENKDSEKAQAEDKPDLEKAELTTRAELFKAVATFGAFAAAMFCVGGPIILALAPGLHGCFRLIAIGLSGIAGFLVVACVLWFYWRLPRQDGRPSAGNRGLRPANGAQQTGSSNEPPQGGSP